MEQQTNLPLSPVVRGLLAVVVLVLLTGGIGLFFGVPEFARDRWPWQLTPFNMRFLGAIYLAELMGAGMLLIVSRWSPARLSLTLAFLFTFLITVISLLHTDRFDFDRRGPWLWLILYGGSALLTGVFLWRHRHLPFADAAALPAWIRTYLRAEGLIIGLYGVFLLLTPGPATDFWPWPIDDFHGRLYSTIFISGGLGAWMLSNITTRAEWLTMGLTQVVFGGFTILGLILVDVDTNRVDWSAAGTWLWLALFVWLAATGAGMLAYWLRLAEAESPVPEAAIAN